MTIEVSPRIVKGMKLSPLQMQKLVEKVFEYMKAQNVITFKEDEKKVYERALNAVKADYQREADLDREVHQMLDKLEKSNPGEFERYKMYPMLKQKMAKDKKVIL